jgi:hypothetical protein
MQSEVHSQLFSEFNVAVYGSVVDRHRFDADPDPPFHFGADPDLDPDPPFWRI